MNPRRDFERRVARLQACLRDEADFAKVHAQFHDELGMLPMLHEASEPHRSEVIETCLAVALEDIDPDSERRTMLCLYVPEHQLWHGQLASDSFLGTFFGFDSLSKLCVGLLGPDGELHYGCITFDFLPPEKAGEPMPFPVAMRGSA